jgi:hypothetical protein
MLSDDPDYILVDPNKKDENGNLVYVPASGVYYIKQKIDGRTYYVLWEPEVVPGQQLQWDPGINYFIREFREGEEQKEGYFYDPDGQKMGQLKYVDGSDSITYFYYPSNITSIDENSTVEDKSHFFYKAVSKEEAKNLFKAKTQVFQINAKIATENGKKVT